MPVTGCGAEMRNLMQVSDDDVAIIESNLDERLAAGVAKDRAQKLAVDDAIRAASDERARLMKAVTDKLPPVLAQRHHTKLLSNHEVSAMLRSGKLPFDLSSAIQTAHWGEAARLAKSRGERRNLLKGMRDFVLRKFDDSLIPVRRWIEDLPLPPLFTQRLMGDLYRASTMRSAMEKEVEVQFATPMYRAIEAAARSHNLPVTTVKKIAGHWMSAKYAPKANAHLIAKDLAEYRKAQRGGNQQAIAEAYRNWQDRVASVNGAYGAPRKRGVAGGMNNAEAAQHVREAESKLTRAELEAIAKPVYAMLQWKKAMDVNSGKVTQTMVNSWPNHPDYVPLTGDPRATRESEDVFTSMGQLNQAKDYAMDGRTDSVADDGIEAAFAGAVKSINHAAFQEFKAGLDAAYGAAGPVNIGLHKEPLSSSTRDDVVIYRHTVVNPNGTESTKAVQFRFDDKRVIDALKKANTERLNAFLRIVDAPTRLYSRAVTQWSLAFAPMNMIRDLWERSELIRVKKIIAANGQKVNVDRAARQSLINAVNPEVWRAVMAHSFRMGHQRGLRPQLEEMIRLGGSSTWGAFLARSAGDLEKQIRKDTFVGATGTVRKGFRFLGRTVEEWNNAFELVAPLSMYLALKKQGVDPKDASFFVLDAMNFKKKGEWMPAIRAMYSFAQPTAHSAANLLEYASTPKGAIRLGVQVAVFYGLYLFLKGLWGDDDDELGNPLDNVSNFVTERSIPIKVPGTNVMVKIPVGFGPPQMAQAVAVAMARYQSGRYTFGDAAGEVVKSWVKALAPIAPSEMEITERGWEYFAMTATPTFFKPLLGLGLKTNTLGAPIYPPFMDPKKPDFAQARRQTPEVYADAAEWTYEKFGIDLAPDTLRHLVESYALGVARDAVTILINNPAKRLREEPERIPFLSSLVDTVNDRSILNSIYYRVRHDLQQSVKDVTAAEELGTEPPEGAQDAAAAYKRFEQAERALSKRRLAIRRDKDLDEAERGAMTAELEREADEDRRQLLREFFAAQPRAR